MRTFVSYFAQTVSDCFGRREVRKALREVDRANFVADAGHASDDGICERLYTTAQFRHNYSRLSIEYAKCPQA